MVFSVVKQFLVTTGNEPLPQQLRSRPTYGSLIPLASFEFVERTRTLTNKFTLTFGLEFPGVCPDEKTRRHTARQCSRRSPLSHLRCNATNAPVQSRDRARQ